VVWKADDRRDDPAVVLASHVAKPQVARDLLPGGVPGPVDLVDPEPERGRPERGRDPQARLLRLRLRADPRAAPARGVRRRPITERAQPGEGRRGPRVVPTGP